MSTVFSNLAAQNLDSGAGIQPLIPSLFAPASQLLSEVTLSTSDDQPAVATENTIVSIAPATDTDGMGTSEKGQLSKEVITTENWTLPPDLVSPDVSVKAPSIVSLRHLLNYQELYYDEMEPVTHLSQASVPTPTIDESSSEDTLSIAIPRVNPVGDDVSRQSWRDQPLRKADGVLLPPSTQSQETALTNTGNSGLPHSTKPHDHQEHTEETLDTTSVNYEPEHISQKDRSDVPMGDASQFQYPLPASDKPAVPLQIQPVVPNLLPSLHSEVQPEHSMERDDVLNQESLSLVQPQKQIAPVPVDKDRFSAPLADASASMRRVSKPKQQQMAEERPEVSYQPLKKRDEATVEPLLGQPPVAKEPELLEASQIAESTAAAQSVSAGFIEPTSPGELIPNISVSHAPTIQDVYHSLQDYSMGEANGAKTEGEAPPINITIGRVVVRATQAVEPAPVKKRVLRPAQSLNAYLKQRERGLQ